MLENQLENSVTKMNKLNYPQKSTLKKNSDATKDIALSLNKQLNLI